MTDLAKLQAAMNNGDDAATSAALFAAVSQARDVLESANAGAPDRDDDLQVACSRLDDWLCANVRVQS